MIRVRALGQSVIEVQRTAVRPDAEVVFATLLVLCAERGRQVERETLLTLLWPRERTTKRRHNLRQVLYKLRHLGVETGDTFKAIMLPASSVWLDFEDGGTTGARESAHELSAPGGVRFMPGFAPRTSKPFTEWLDALRGRAEGKVRRRLIDAIAGARRDGRWEDVDKLARNCLQLDPLNEEATLALAESIALSGAKSKAVAMLDAYVAELGADATDVRLPATILRRRIADRMAPRRLQVPLETKLIGREDVMQKFTAVLDETKAGRAATHAVWGAPGIGKTRVLEEIGNVAALMGGRVFAQNAAPDDPQTPGLSLVRLLRVMMDAPGVLGIAPDVLALLRQLTAQAPGVESDQPVDLGDDVLVRAVVDLERALAWEGLIVIVLDDLHHADALSRRVLGRAQGCLTSERVLLLTGSIPQPAEGAMPGVTMHQIGRLSAPAAANLAAAFLEKAGATADASTIDALATASGGHPFVLREAVIAWLRDPGTTTHSTLEATLQRRVGSLSAEARDVLFTTLILGEHASVSLLMGCATLPAVDVERALVELEQEQIVRCAMGGAVSTHSLWRNSVETLVPTALAVARRHRVAQLLEEASRHTADSAELLLASATLYQRSGDVSRAASILAQSGAALKERALAPGAYAAFSRAAELAPGAADFERCIAQALFAGWNAHIAEEVGPLVQRFGDRLRRSAQLTQEERGEVDVIAIEVAHAFLGDRANGVVCRAMLENNALTPRQRLRVAISGAQAADQDYDFATVAAIAHLVEGTPLDDAYARHLARQIAMVHSVSTGQLDRARTLADEELRRICEDLPPKDRCRPLLSARIPFWFDCDFERVEQIIDSARMALRSYSGTIDALRTEDVYATHCLDTMRLDEAETVIVATSELAQTFSFRGLQENFAELQIRLRIARADRSVTDAVCAEISRREPMHGCARHRTFALCNAAVGLARVHDNAALADVVTELETHWQQLLRSCPFDYAAIALAIGMSALKKRSHAEAMLVKYVATARVARHPPSPFVSSLATEFHLNLC